jgi:hypothetical protein
VVLAVRREWRGAVELDVTTSEGTIRALAYPELTGRPEAGDRLLLNTSALALGLGTGGYALVVALPDRMPADPTGPGHLVKARYTPLQATVQGADEQGSPHHDVLRDAVGQSFGGDLETVTLHTGLLAARHVLGADVAVVSQGPGNLGTGTRWGFSGVACGEAVNAAAVLGGRPVASLRISEADPRERHHGVSHHSLTSYGRVALARADVVVPDLPGAFGARVAAQAAALAGRHTLVIVSTDGLSGVLRGSPVPLSTMGRGLEEDPAYFLAAAAAGRHAAALLASTRSGAPGGPGPE